MSVRIVVGLLQEAISILTGGNAQSQGPSETPEVFDLQELGYTRIAGVERARQRLISTGEKLALKFVSTLPEWWYVQDAEDYISMTQEQKDLQAANCSNARFRIAIMGQSAAGDGHGHSMLWRTFHPAQQVSYDSTNEKWVETPILHDGAPVYAVADDSVTRGGKVLTTNPRVRDMEQVIMSAYEYFYLVNKDAVLDIEQAYIRD